MPDFFHKESTTPTNVDKKKRKSRPSSPTKAMTNGVNGNKSPSSPPLSKRRNEICEEEEEEVAKNNCDEPKKKGGGISHFFRPISKTDFIKENENYKSILTVKALVHSPTSSVMMKKDEGETKKRRKSGGCSKYIRRSEETDVIQVLDNGFLEDKENGMSEDVALAAATTSVTDSCSSRIPSSPSEKKLCISTKQMFKPKTKKSNGSVISMEVEDEVTVDIDFPLLQTVKPNEASSAAAVGPKELFKNRPVASASAARKRKKANMKVDTNGYDSDSIDVDVLATFNAKTFARSAEASPPLESSSTDSSSNNAFSVLMKKPLLKSAKDELASSDSGESQVHRGKNDDNDHGDRLLELESKIKAVGGGDAFARLMAPKAKVEEGDSFNEAAEKKSGRKRKRIAPDILNSSADDFTTGPSKEQQQQQPLPSRRKSERIRKSLETKPKHYEDDNDDVISKENGEERSDLSRNGKKPQKRRKKPQQTCVAVAKSGLEPDCSKEAEKEDDDDEIKIEKVIEKPIAPIFALRPNRKQQAVGRTNAQQKRLECVDPEKAAARKAFLLSSVPDSLLKSQKRLESSHLDLDSSLTPFASTIGHVNYDRSFPPPPEADIKLRADCTHIPRSLLSMAGYHGRLSSSSSREERSHVPIKREIHRLTVSQIYCQLVAVHQEPSDFKVFRRYLERKIEADGLEEEARNKNISLNEIEEARCKSGRRRRRRRRGGCSSKLKKKAKKKNPEASGSSGVEEVASVKYDPELASSMQWTMKYAPRCSEDIIGNGSVVSELASWLSEWEARDRRQRRRRKKLTATDSDEDSMDDYYSTSSSSGEDEEQLANTALLIGPTGVGKTATVYALAHEMGFKVLEVNASSPRNGRQVLSNLREATQSHDVRNKQVSDRRTALILFEDIELIFGEADEGFYSAVNSLIASTKRPILLTTSNPSFLAMQKSSKAKVLKQLPQAFIFRPVEAAVAARHLQLLALVEGFATNLSDLIGLVSRCEGNVSRSMLSLQCLIMSGHQSDIDRGAIRADHQQQRLHTANEKETLATIVGLMGLDLQQMPTEACCSLPTTTGVVSSDFARPNSSAAMILPSIFEWYSMLPHSKVSSLPDLDGEAGAVAQKQPEKVDTITMKRVNLHLSRAFFAADEEDEESMTTAISERETTSSVAGEAKTRADCCSGGRAAMNLLTKYTEAASIFLTNGPIEDNELHNEIMDFFGVQSDYKNHEHELAIRNHLHEAGEALGLADNCCKLSAFVDIIPTVRGISRSEAARKVAKQGGGQRSRASRFIHYLDSVACLSHSSLAFLERSFSYN